MCEGPFEHQIRPVAKRQKESSRDRVLNASSKSYLSWFGGWKLPRLEFSKVDCVDGSSRRQCHLSNYAIETL